MLTRERIAAISKLAFPVAIALSSELVMELIDLAMVGPLGTHASAAVGLSVFSHTLMMAFVLGIAPAVQGLVARRRGEGSTEPSSLPLNGGLLAALLVGIPLAVGGYLLAPFIFSVISSDPAVTKIGIPFLRALCISIVATGLHCAFKGHWAGIEKPKIYMGIVLFMNCLNFTGNYVLIHGRFGFPALGATGAAISTAVSLYVGVAINFVLGWLLLRRDGFLGVKPARDLVVRILKMGMPATMQEFFFSAGYLVFLYLVGKVGTAELAAANLLVRVSMVLLILATSVGVASATLVARTVGEGDVTAAAQWGWDAAKIGVLGITLLGLPIFLFPRMAVSMFFSDPHTIAIALLPLRLQAATVGMGSVIYILAYTLISLGDGNRVAMISFGTQWLLFLPAVWFVGPHLHYGLLQITLVDVAYGAVAAVLVMGVWADGRWKKITI